MTTANPDTDTILAEPTELKLLSGFPVKVERIKTRATLALLRILLRGAGDVLFRGNLNPDSDEFQKDIVFAVLFSIPEDPDGTLDFLRLMVKPAQLREEGRITKGDESWNEDLWNQLEQELTDPEVEDLIDVVAEIVRNEGPHLQALGKKLAALAKTMGRGLPTNSSEETAPKKSSRRAPKNLTQTDS